jgi:uncharacterized membrane protein YwaF
MLYSHYYASLSFERITSFDISSTASILTVLLSFVKKTDNKKKITGIVVLILTIRN